MALTPMKVRGSYRKKAKLSASDSASLNDHAASKSASSSSKSEELVKRAIEANARPASAKKAETAESPEFTPPLPSRPLLSSKQSRLLETLPVEILEMIFLYADSVDFPRASPVLGRALSSQSLLIKFTMNRFMLTWDLYRGRTAPEDLQAADAELLKADPDSVHGKLEGELMTQKWLTYDIFMGALSRWHKSRNMQHWYACKMSKQPFAEELNPDSSSQTTPPVPSAPLVCTCADPLDLEACLENEWEMYRKSMAYRYVVPWSYIHFERYPVQSERLKAHILNTATPGHVPTAQDLADTRRYADEDDMVEYLRIDRAPAATVRSLRTVPCFRSPNSFQTHIFPEHIMWAPWFERGLTEPEYGEKRAPQDTTDIAQRTKLLFMLSRHHYDRNFQRIFDMPGHWEVPLAFFQSWVRFFEYYSLKPSADPGIPPVEVLALAISCCRPWNWPLQVFNDQFESCSQVRQALWERGDITDLQVSKMDPTNDKIARDIFRLGRRCREVSELVGYLPGALRMF
ncbi:hypothetical protein BROUX41_002809 [Berkeleyomyces rouxiae]|uniref:uncharacterized protein n=1 Tax=Berkeleyomyces rouxiae TaxID=2035830 RepID=UPI003B7CDC8E